MTKTDDRFEDFKGIIGSIDKRVKDLEDKMGQTREEALASNLEYYKLITKAVAEGNKPIMEKIDEIDKRISVLENAEANRALEQKKNTYSLIKTTAITMIAGYVLMAMFTNGVAIISEALKTSSEKEVNTNEISKTDE